MSRYDADGQPTTWQFGSSRVCRRGLDELIGLCKGVMADGKLTAEEAKLLLSWLNTNWSVQDVWPANILVARFERILEHGVIEQEELRDLEETLQKMIGGEPVYGYRGMMATRLPLCDPQPPVDFEGREFCLTGKFVFGSRARCEEAIEERGGRCVSGVRSATNYVVIGSIGSRDWAHSTHGTKIEKAMEYRDRRGTGLAIIAEEHWVQHVDQVPPSPRTIDTTRSGLAVAMMDVGIPGVGNDTAFALSEHFSGLDALLDATAEDLMEVRGVGPGKARGIAMFLADPFNVERLRRAAGCVAGN